MCNSHLNLSTAVVRVIEFDENDVEPEYIPRDQFYRRYTLEYKARTIKVGFIPANLFVQRSYVCSQNQGHQHVCARNLITRTTIRPKWSCISARVLPAVELTIRVVYSLEIIKKPKRSKERLKTVLPLQGA